MNLIAASIGAMLFIAQVDGGSSMPMQPSTTNRSFQTIEQPLPVKIGVVFGGLTLVGVELWWFLGRKQQKRQATQTNGVQEVIILHSAGCSRQKVIFARGSTKKLQNK
jgi:plastocyanin domain-containing protein